MRAIFLALLFAVNCVAADKQRCDCKKAAKEEKTRSGGNEHIVDKEEKIYKLLHGAVDTINSQLTVLVEVFDNPDHLLLNYPENLTNRKPQKRIAACKTGADGRFCFRNIPPGKYEMRFSIGPNWNVKSVYVVLEPKNPGGTSEEMYVLMRLGT